MRYDGWTYYADLTNPGNAVAVTGVLLAHPKFPARRMAEAVIPATGEPDSPVRMGQILRYLLLDRALFRPITRDDVALAHPTLHRWLVTRGR